MSDEIACSHCTYINLPSAPHCTMCERPLRAGDTTGQTYTGAPSNTNDEGAPPAYREGLEDAPPAYAGLSEGAVRTAPGGPGVEMSENNFSPYKQSPLVAMPSRGQEREAEDEREGVGGGLPVPSGPPFVRGLEVAEEALPPRVAAKVFKTFDQQPQNGGLSLGEWTSMTTKMGWKPRMTTLAWEDAGGSGMSYVNQLMFDRWAGQPNILPHIRRLEASLPGA